MNETDLQAIVLQNQASLAQLTEQVSLLRSHDEKVRRALQILGQRLHLILSAFDRDKYKGTDHRLQILALGQELLIFDRLGYDLETQGSDFLLGVASLLDGRNRIALDYFERFLQEVPSKDRLFGSASYLAGMICYNRAEFQRASEFFTAAFDHSPEKDRDWQSMIYVGELAYFMRKPREEIERIFGTIEDGLRTAEDTARQNALRATLYLKWGNCCVGTFLPPAKANPMVDNQVAVRHFKKARSFCPAHAPVDSLLPAVIDLSLAQALLLAKAIDLDLGKTPSELLADVFHRLRKIVLTKREEIILSQCYLMLGTSAFYSSHLSKELGEIYLEYAQQQTLVVPSDVCFYSSISKELLSRDEFVRQIDYYAKEMEQLTNRRR